MGNAYVAGVVQGGVSAERYSNGIYASKAWFGLEDNGRVHEGTKGNTGQVGRGDKNSRGCAYGSEEEVEVEVDMDSGLMRFWREGQQLAQTITIPAEARCSSSSSMVGAA